MNTDALVLGIIAIADLGFIVYLRRLQYRRRRMERMMGSLRLAVRWANGVGARPAGQRVASPPVPSSCMDIIPYAAQ